MQLFKKLKKEKKEKADKELQAEQRQKERESDIKTWLKNYRNPKYFQKINMKNFHIPNSKTFFYIESYITKTEADLLQKIINSQEESKWVHLHHSNRKLQRWGGIVKNEGLCNIEKIPDWLDILAERLDYSGITEKDHYCNHYLLNHYQGANGIMPHTDGPLYHPYVTVVSLGSSVLFKIFKDFDKYKEDEEMANVLVEGGSLLVFCDEYYHDCLHCIQNYKIDTVKVEYYCLEEEEEFKVVFEKCSVDNLLMTSLYKEVFKVFEEKSDFDGIEGVLEFFKELEFEDYNFEVKVEGEKLVVYVTWERKERISMTIRHVQPAEEEETG